jgi:hypothetical protein
VNSRGHFRRRNAAEIAVIASPIGNGSMDVKPTFSSGLKYIVLN